jgi:flagellar biosynthesis protein FlhG
MAVEKKKARRIAVISGKGGVGKTVITANMAAALSCIGRRILVVDADLGLANLDIMLGVDPRFTIQDVLHGICPLEEVLLPTARGFDLLPAGSGVPEDTQLTPALAEKIESLLRSLEDRYDAILFDAGAGVGDVVLFFANLAHEILLVVTPEPASLMDAYATIKILSQLYARSEFLLVVNQADPNCSGQIGVSVANHLQNVISRFLGPSHQNPVRVELIGSIPQDPTIPKAIRQRQLLADISPQAPATCLMNHLAGFFDTRMQKILPDLI